MSIYDHKGPLRKDQKRHLRDHFADTARTELKDVVVEYDRHYSPEAFQHVEQVFGQFMQAVFEKAAQRALFTPEERSTHIQALAAAFQRVKTALEISDERQLDSFVDTTDEHAQQLFSREQRERHAAHATVFKSKHPVRLDAETTAAHLVDTYAQLLLTHKIVLGIEARYSEEEIIAHLQTVFSPEQLANIRQIIQQHKTERSAGASQGPHTLLGIYSRVLSAVFKEQPLAAGVFMSGAAFLGYLAPQMAAHIGEFGKTGEQSELLKGTLGYGLASMLGRVELSRQIGNFLNTKLYAEAGVGHDICARVIESSPELFTKTDHALIRQYIEDTIANIEKTAAISVEGIASHVAQIVGLSSMLALRLRNPALFLPVVAATAINSYIALKGGKDISSAEHDVRIATAEFFGQMDEAMQTKGVKGRAELKGQSHVLSQLEAARKKLSDTIAKYDRASGTVALTILAMNGLLMNTTSPHFLAEWVESSVFSTQLSSELSSLIQSIGQLQRTLRPIAEFVDLASQFKERGESEPTEWNISFQDVTRKGLTIPKLEIPHGDLAVVVGETGAGKSTLFEILYGFQVERGLMRVDGIWPSELNMQSYRRGIAISNQSPVVETKSLKDNLIGEGVEFDADIFADCVREHGFDVILEKFQVQHHKHAERPAEEIVLNKDFVLSGGQRKQLSFLAIDYRLRVNPDSVKMILIDEPDTGLDALIVPRVYERIAQWRKQYPDKTIVIVNHDAALFPFLDDTVHIIGVESNGVVTQDESLAQARLHEGTPFHRLFGGAGEKQSHS